MLELTDVKKTFNAGTINEKHALNGVSISLEDGDFVTIIGGNGAGKSTTLNAIAGVWPIDSGSIVINGQNVVGLPEHKRAKFIGRVFQDPMTGTAATMEIQENLALAKRRGQPRGLKWGITQKEREEYHELLKTLDLGLEDRMTSKVGLLSGGILLKGASWLHSGVASTLRVCAAREMTFLRAAACPMTMGDEIICLAAPGIAAASQTDESE